MSGYFVRPELVTLPVFNGDTITIRKELSTGQERTLFEASRIPGSDPPKADNVLMPRALLVAYLVDWTLADDTGTRVDIRGMASADLAVLVDELKPPITLALVEAIVAHRDALAAEEKKIPPGASAS